MEEKYKVEIRGPIGSKYWPDVTNLTHLDNRYFRFDDQFGKRVWVNLAIDDRIIIEQV